MLLLFLSFGEEGEAQNQVGYSFFSLLFVLWILGGFVHFALV